ncbi:MAG: carbohydrate binding family 9 domain-containing protein, partial [Bacteroidales bacterium]
MKRILVSLMSLLLLASVAGQAPEKKRYKAEKLTVAPDIDGVLDDEAWKNTGTWIDDFTQYEPYNGKGVSQRTEFKILFDDNNLYAAFKAFDTSPDSIVNRLTRRDSPDGDLVAILIDSYHDLRTAYMFGIASSGVKYDQIYINDGERTDASWDPNWWVKTS